MTFEQFVFLFKWNKTSTPCHQSFRLWTQVVRIVIEKYLKNCHSEIHAPRMMSKRVINYYWEIWKIGNNYEYSSSEKMTRQVVIVVSQFREEFCEFWDFFHELIYDYMMYHIIRDRCRILTTGGLIRCQQINVLSLILSNTAGRNWRKWFCIHYKHKQNQIKTKSRVRRLEQTDTK